MKKELAELPRRILIIDDDAVICEIAEAMLSESGWSAAHAYTPQEALNATAGESWPVVLCDVHLPGDSGELLKKLRQGSPHTQIVMITGDPTVTSMRQALREGVYDYLLKPLRREELIRVTDFAFERHRLIVERDELEADNERYRAQLEELVEKRTGQLRDTELRYRTLFDLAVDAILLVSEEDYTISELNGTAARMLGGRAFDLQGRKLQDFVGKQMDECFAAPNKEQRKVWRFSKLVFNAIDRGEHVTGAVVSRITLDGRDYLQLVARESADSAELALRAELMEMELMSEQRLASIGLLASGVAHNINTPLMGIYGIAQIIKMKHPEISDIDGVIAQVERINGIVRNLMWKSRQDQELAKQDVNLNVLLQEELRFLEADMDFKHNVTKEFSFADDLPPIWGRYGDFSQSLTNIIRNALDSMHDVEDKTLRVRTSVSNGDIRVDVEDTGGGIEASHLERIFEPFFTTKPAVGRSGDDRPTGTGLGLSTVQKLLTPYGCRFDVHSEPERGTRFSVLIPVAQNQPEEDDSSLIDSARLE